MDTTADLQLETARSHKALQALLHGEVTAAETYELAIERLGTAAPAELKMCQQSHQKRIERLTQRISELGVKPDDSSGTLGAFFRLLESGTLLFGVGAAIGSLEEGEDHGLALYREQLDELDPESRRIVEAELLPEQLRTHDLLSGLCNQPAPALDEPPQKNVSEPVIEVKSPLPANIE